MLPVLDGYAGVQKRAQILKRAGIFALPDGTKMIPEGEAARLHQQLRREEPGKAARLAEEAGRLTAEYILAHRIPKPVQWLLKALPAGLAARLLAKAIEKHAWTFVGSGRFRIIDAWTFEIENNPLICGEASDHCLCHWHAGVFARLYQELVSPTCQCEETCCGAVTGGGVCRFELYRAVKKAGR
jgi:divinyl protochlorophyllide a 8-vinyl-reductase